MAIPFASITDFQPNYQPSGILAGILQGINASQQLQKNQLANKYAQIQNAFAPAGFQAQIGYQNAQTSAIPALTLLRQMQAAEIPADIANKNAQASLIPSKIALNAANAKLANFRLQNPASLIPGQAGQVNQLFNWTGSQNQTDQQKGQYLENLLNSQIGYRNRIGMPTVQKIMTAQDQLNSPQQSNIPGMQNQVQLSPEEIQMRDQIYNAALQKQTSDASTRQKAQSFNNLQTEINKWDSVMPRLIQQYGGTLGAPSRTKDAIQYRLNPNISSDYGLFNTYQTSEKKMLQDTLRQAFGTSVDPNYLQSNLLPAVDPFSAPNAAIGIQRWNWLKDFIKTHAKETGKYVQFGIPTSSPESSKNSNLNSDQISKLAKQYGMDPSDFANFISSHR